jgi:hypothetical protein
MSYACEYTVEGDVDSYLTAMQDVLEGRAVLPAYGL